MKVRVAHMYSSDYSGSIHYYFDEYLRKGFKINQQSNSASNHSMEVFFIDIRCARYKEKMRGMQFDDITGNYDSEDLMRLKRDQ